MLASAPPIFIDITSSDTATAGAEANLKKHDFSTFTTALVSVSSHLFVAIFAALLLLSPFLILGLLIEMMES